mmetsp:Transcript_6815/g.18804  ORF Transcript_6815/g.18804 Transcript_6815/m.18804 type:complete len:214 (-) Transcript_6815:994-1635(-)
MCFGYGRHLIDNGFLCKCWSQQSRKNSTTTAATATTTSANVRATNMINAGRRPWSCCTRMHLLLLSHALRPRNEMAKRRCALVGRLLSQMPQIMHLGSRVLSRSWRWRRRGHGRLAGLGNSAYNLACRWLRWRWRRWNYQSAKICAVWACGTCAGTTWRRRCPEGTLRRHVADARWGGEVAKRRRRSSRRPRVRGAWPLPRRDPQMRRAHRAF